jgi:hypothetical protein
MPATSDGDRCRTREHEYGKLRVLRSNLMRWPCRFCVGVFRHADRAAAETAERPSELTINLESGITDAGSLPNRFAEV